MIRQFNVEFIDNFNPLESWKVFGRKCDAIYSLYHQINEFDWKSRKDEFNSSLDSIFLKPTHPHPTVSQSLVVEKLYKCFLSLQSPYNRQTSPVFMTFHGCLISSVNLTWHRNVDAFPNLWWVLYGTNGEHDLCSVAVRMNQKRKAVGSLLSLDPTLQWLFDILVSSCERPTFQIELIHCLIRWNKNLVSRCNREKRLWLKHWVCHTGCIL